MKNPFKKQPSSLDVTIEEQINAYRRLPEDSDEARRAAETLKILVDTRNCADNSAGTVSDQVKVALIGAATTFIGYLLITKAEETIPVVSKAAQLIPKIRL